MTTAQVHRGPDAVSVRFGAHDITVPEPLAGLVTELIDTGRRYVGVGAPTASPWLFPDTCPAARLRPPDWANGCAPSASAPCPGGGPPCSSSPPKFPPRSSPTSSISASEPLPAGPEKPVGTGRATPPNLPGSAVTAPDECPCVNTSNYRHST